MQQEHFTLCNPDQPIAWSSGSNPKQLFKFIQNAAGTFHCRFCAPDAAVTQLYLGIWNSFFFLLSIFLRFFLVCATGRCVFSLHWGLCAPVTPVTLSHLVPAIAINIFLFQLCIYYIFASNTHLHQQSPFNNHQLASATIFKLKAVG